MLVHASVGMPPSVISLVEFALVKLVIQAQPVVIAAPLGSMVLNVPCPAGVFLQAQGHVIT